MPSEEEVEQARQAYEATLAAERAEVEAAARADAERRAAEAELRAAADEYVRLQLIWPMTEEDIPAYERDVAPKLEAARRRYEAAEEAVNGPNWRERRQRRLELSTKGSVDWWW